MDDSLTCQRCHQPLLRDATVSGLTPTQYALIAGTLPEPSRPSNLPPAAKLAALPPASRPAAAAWASANPAIAESYVFLPNDHAHNHSRAPQASTPPRISSPAPPRARQRTVSSTSTSASASATPSRPDTPSRASPPSESQQPNLAPLALASKLDSLLSSRTAIDHPLCTECTGLFQAELQRELEELTRERDAYITFERTLRRRADAAERGAQSESSKRGKGGDADEDGVTTGLVGTQEEWSALLARKKELEEEEAALRATLKERETEFAAVKTDEERVRAEEAAVEREEEEFLTAHAALADRLTHLAHTLSSAKTQLLLSQSLLSHLESTNVYTDAFQIGSAPLVPDASGQGGRSSASVGTINGLRLGGRPLVDWDEINAAWGLVALCIDRLAVKVGCVLEGYRIVPLGSFSRLEELNGKNKGAYELYASGDLSPTRILHNRRFNHALVGLLECLRQLVEHGAKQGLGWEGGGFEIAKDKINGHSIRLPGITSGMPSLGSMSIMGLGGSSAAGGDAGAAEASADEQWTRACRTLLGLLKRILLLDSEAQRG